MKRRSFIKGSVLTGVLTGSALIGKASERDFAFKNSNPEFYELRVYTLKNET
jgi:hypothetical protein